VREADGPFDVFVLRTDGSGQVAAVDHPAHDEVMGWSPDGRLLFTSDRTGSDGLWAQTMADGRPKGSPDLLRADIGEFTYPAGITSSGSLYVFKRVGNLDVQVATVDFESGRLSSPPRGFTKGFRFDPRLPGAWSPDGKLLAYPTACQDTWCVTIRSVETGESRQLPIKTVRPMLWWPDSRSVGVNRDDGITRIDVETGAVLERITIPVRCIGQRRLTPDGSTLIYVRTTCRVDPNGGVAVVERNLRTGVERDVFTGTGLGGDIDVSPDGTHVAVKQLDGASRTTRLLVIPFKAGAPREVLTAKEPDLLGAVEWAPDSKRLVVGQRVSSETMVSIVPTDGSPSKKLDLGPDFGRSDGGGSGFRVSRDGRIALLVGSNSREVWALENILPR
jgi:dipeptidyl aminopeptidase/acylaminoacyl peptidase